MSRRSMGILLLLAGCEMLGLLSGHWYFGIFKKTVPAAVVTDFNRSAAYGYFLWRGLLLGLVFFLFSALVQLLAPLFRASETAPSPDRNPR